MFCSICCRQKYTINLLPAIISSRPNVKGRAAATSGRISHAGYWAQLTSSRAALTSLTWQPLSANPLRRHSQTCVLAWWQPLTEPALKPASTPKTSKNLADWSVNLRHVQATLSRSRNKHLLTLRMKAHVSVHQTLHLVLWMKPTILAWISQLETAHELGAPGTTRQVDRKDLNFTPQIWADQKGLTAQTAQYFVGRANCKSSTLSGQQQTTSHYWEKVLLSARLSVRTASPRQANKKPNHSNGCMYCG